MAPIAVDLARVTLGQAAFLEEHTGRTLEQLQQILQEGDPAGADYEAVLAVYASPDNPAAAVPDIRRLMFICEFTGRTLDEFRAALGSDRLRARDVLALVAAGLNPDSPATAVPAASRLRAADLH
jgi:hypothetical protein